MLLTGFEPSTFWVNALTTEPTRHPLLCLTCVLYSWGKTHPNWLSQTVGVFEALLLLVKKRGFKLQAFFAGAGTCKTGWWVDLLEANSPRETPEGHFRVTAGRTLGWRGEGEEVSALCAPYLTNWDRGLQTYSVVWTMC